MKGRLLIFGLGENIGKSQLKGLLSQGASHQRAIQPKKHKWRDAKQIYTSSHNHPGPDLLGASTNQLTEEQLQEPEEAQYQPTEIQYSPTQKQVQQSQEPEEEEKEQNQPITTTSDEDHSFHYLQSPTTNCDGEIVRRTFHGEFRESSQYMGYSVGCRAHDPLPWTRDIFHLYTQIRRKRLF